MAWAFEQDIPSGPKFVLVALCNRANEDTGECWPGLSTVAKNCGMGRRTVERHIQALAELGLIAITARATDSGGQTSNLYRIISDGVAKLAPPPRQIGVAPPAKLAYQETKVKETKVETTTATTGAGLMVQLFQTHIAYITDPMSQTIRRFSDQFPNLSAEDIEYAFNEATESNARNWKFVAAILTRIGNGGSREKPQHDVAGRNGRIPGGRAGQRGKRHPSGDFSKEVAAQNAQERARKAARRNGNE